MDELQFQAQVHGAKFNRPVIPDQVEDSEEAHKRWFREQGIEFREA